MKAAKCTSSSKSERSLCQDVVDLQNNLRIFYTIYAGGSPRSHAFDV